MEILRAESLSKSFGGLKAVDNISFSVEKGERVVILGPNGAGKSTLLNLIDGQLTVSRGRLFFIDQDITDISQHKRVHLGISRSYQINKLFFSLSVKENLILSIQGITASRFQMFRPLSSYKHLHNKADYLLEMMGLYEKRNEPADNLSYGEQRKLEIALSLAPEPKLLILDEPNCGLTATESADIMGIIDKLGADITVMMITHDIDLVFDDLVSRVIVLHHGQLIADGAVEQIQNNKKVREVYIGFKEELESVSYS